MHPEHYPQPIAEIRKKYYPSISKEVYLDHAGATLYSSLLLDRLNVFLKQNLLANPHSRSLNLRTTEELIQKTRLDVLSLLNTSPTDYDVVFCANSTAGMKILVQDGFSSFPFSYIYAYNSHTSAIGIREYAKNWSVFDPSMPLDLEAFKGSPLLVSWCGQSNFNGDRAHSESVLAAVKHAGDNVFTLLDAASLCTTSPPSLAELKPDFVVCSFYKIFGIPDLGALLVRKCAKTKEIFQRKSYFGGGTVDALTVNTSFYARSKQLSTALEDGTLPLHNIAMLLEAIKCHKEIYGGFDNISAHVTDLTSYTVNKLLALKHKSGAPMAEILGDVSNYGIPSKQGPIITFVLISSEGDRLGYHDFELLASMKNISIRTGTLCNIGGFLHWSSELSESDIIHNFQKYRHRCGDSQDVIGGKVTGAIRVSFGAMSSYEDADTLIEAVRDYFVNTLGPEPLLDRGSFLIKICSLFIYPIKSCHFFEIKPDIAWPLNKTGLKYDRMFCLLDIQSQKPLRLKHCAKMVNIRPVIVGDTMSIEDSSSGKKLELSLLNWKELYQTKLVDEYMAIVDKEVIQFFNDALQIPCYLAVSLNESPLQNKSPFLMITKDSIQAVKSENPKTNTEHLFRANIVVEGQMLGLPAFDEDLWDRLYLQRDKQLVLQNYSKCDRCHMITINQETGERDTSVFKNLKALRKENGKIYFGQHLRLAEDIDRVEAVLEVGDVFSVNY